MNKKTVQRQPLVKGSNGSANPGGKNLSQDENHSPILSDEDWLEQQLDESGIKNPLLRKQFKVCFEGFTLTGVGIDGKPNPDSWQKRNRYPEKHLNKDGKPIKYITQKKKPGEEHGRYDAFLPAGAVVRYGELRRKCFEFLESLPEGDRRDILLSLGQFLLKYPKFPIAITEGGKKDCCGIENGYITISIPGCSMWRKSQSTEFVPILDALCVKGRPVYVALDADFREKPEVKQQIWQFSKALEKRGCDVKICVWELAKGKGMDDFIVGGGDFDKVIAQALTIAQWEKQFYNDCTPQSERKQSDKKEEDKEGAFTPFILAVQVAEIKEPCWRYDNILKVWREWDGRHWKELEPERVLDFLIETGGKKVKSHNFVEQAEKLLRSKLRRLNKQDKDYPVFGKNQDCIYFRNGVLRLEDKYLVPHQRDNLNTNYVDRDYIPLKEDLGDPVKNLEQYCPLVYEFLSYAANGDRDQLLKYIHCLAGVLLGRYNWNQRFPLIHGKPGTGKGTFTRMMVELLGQENVAGTSLADMGDKFQRERWLGKRVALCPDERTWVKDISLILKATGHDLIPFDRKHKDPGSSVYWGTLVIVFNKPCFGSDPAIDRRADLILFNNIIKKRSRAKEVAMMREIGALASVLLSIPTELIDMGISGEIDTSLLAIQRWELECDNNSVAAFLDEMLVPMPGYRLLQKTAYTMYQFYCSENGMNNRVTNRSFGKKMEEAATQAGIPMERIDGRGGKILVGFDVRVEHGKNQKHVFARTVTQEMRFQAGIDAYKSRKTSPSSPHSPPKPSQGKGSNSQNYHHNITTSGDIITTDEGRNAPKSEGQENASGKRVVKTSPPVVKKVVKKEPETTIYQESGDNGDNFEQFPKYRAGNEQAEKTDPLADPWGDPPITEKDVSNDSLPELCVGDTVIVKNLGHIPQFIRHKWVTINKIGETWIEVDAGNHGLLQLSPSDVFRQGSPET